MIISPPTQPLPRDKAGEIIYPVDNGEPLSNDTEHLNWITFIKNGLEDWFGDRKDVFVAADLLWYPIQGRPDISKAPDVMVVLNHPAGPRMSYKQWEENNRPPQVVFEFLSSSNTAGEMMDKLDFYSDLGCEEFYMYDYQRGTFRAYHREDLQHPLTKAAADAQGCWLSPLLNVTFGLDGQGALWVRRADGLLMETQKEIRQRADEAGQRANRLAAKLRELGIDPDSL